MSKMVAPTSVTPEYRAYRITLPCKQTPNGTQNRTRQHKKPRYRGALTKSILNKHGQDDTRSNEHRLHQSYDDRCDAELTMSEYLNAQKRLVKPGLSPSKQAQHRDTHNHECDGDKDVIGRGEGRQPIKQHHHATSKQRNRNQIERSLVKPLEIFERERARDDNEQSQRRHENKQRTPTNRINQDARDRWTDGRRKTDDESDNTHGATPALAGKDQNNQRKNRGHKHTPWRLPGRCVQLNSHANEGAAAHSPDPAANNAMPPTNRRRVGNRPSRNALSGMMTASTKEYPLVSHCTVVAFTSRCSMIVGNAGVRSVWLSTARSAPSKRTATIENCCRVSPINTSKKTKRAGQDAGISSRALSGSPSPTYGSPPCKQCVL